MCGAPEYRPACETPQRCRGNGRGQGLCRNSSDSLSPIEVPHLLHGALIEGVIYCQFPPIPRSACTRRMHHFFDRHLLCVQITVIHHTIEFRGCDVWVM